MKRIHLKRKPPMVKRKGFDGTTKSVKTKHVRMAPVLASVPSTSHEEIPTVGNGFFFVIIHSVYMMKAKLELPTVQSIPRICVYGGLA